MRSRGFTLVEMMVALGIGLLLAAGGLSAADGILRQRRATAATEERRHIREAIERYVQEKGVMPKDLTSLRTPVDYFRGRNVALEGVSYRYFVTTYERPFYYVVLDHPDIGEEYVIPDLRSASSPAFRAPSLSVAGVTRPSGTMIVMVRALDRDAMTVIPIEVFADKMDADGVNSGFGDFTLFYVRNPLIRFSVPSAIYIGRKRWVFARWLLDGNPPPVVMNRSGGWPPRFTPSGGTWNTPYLDVLIDGNKRLEALFYNG